jgi:starvation-inducible DNA-binding protein
MNTKAAKSATSPSRHASSVSLLSTPTDLTSRQVEAVTRTINPILADTVALYIKVKNFHWHLVSSHYRDYHILFDEHAEQLLASIDPLAERVRRIGGTTLRSVGHVQELSSIKDDDDTFVSAADMLKRLLSDNLQIAKQIREAIELTQDNRDHPTSDLLISLLDEAEKRIWFLHETIECEENTN